jgi:predicted component of type VI protein secretion system
MKMGFLSCRSRVMSYEEEILKADELGKEDCILEPEVIVTVKEEVKVSAEYLEFIAHISKYIFRGLYKCVYHMWVCNSSFNM